MRTLIGVVVLSLIIFPGAALGDCATAPGNLVTNCNFTNTINGWSQTTGTFSHDLLNGSNAPGAMHIVSAAEGLMFQQVTQTAHCVLLGVGPAHNYGIDHQLVAGVLPADSCVISVAFHINPTCSNTHAALSPVPFTPGSTFQQTPPATGPTIGFGILSAFLIIRCAGPAFGAPFTILLDDAFFGTNDVYRMLNLLCMNPLA